MVAEEETHIFKPRTADKFVTIKLIQKWTASLFQVIWVDVLCYLGIYYGLAFLYWVILHPIPAAKKGFEDWVTYMQTMEQFVPLTFLLSHFVNHILMKWWEVVCLLPRMPTHAMFLQTHITAKNPEDKETVRNIRFTMLRYLNITYILSLRSLSDPIQERFATHVHTPMKQAQMKFKEIVLQAIHNVHSSVREKLLRLNEDEVVQDTLGYLISEDEVAVYEHLAVVDGSSSAALDADHILPIQWALRLLQKAKEAGFVESDNRYMQLVDNINTFNDSLRTIWLYDTYANLLAYTQVTIIATYSYFVINLFAAQVTEGSQRNSLNLYFPIFAIFRFVFFVGWFKVGYMLVDPMKDNEVDFPTGEALTKNLKWSATLGASEDKMYPKWMGEFSDGEEILYKNLPDQVVAIPAHELMGVLYNTNSEKSR